MNKVIFALGGTAVVALAAGAAGGYLFAKHQLEEEFDEQMKQEIAATKAFYSAMHKKGAFATPEEAVAQLIPDAIPNQFATDRDTMLRIMKGLNYHPDASAAVRGEGMAEAEAEIFEEVKEALDVDPEEIPEPNPDVPYIISRADHDDAEVGFRQLTLTYFAGDQMLVDEDEDRVEDLEKWVGLGNLKRFGLQSGDPNVVYIRNERMQVDFEVVRSTGTYKELVLGLTGDE